MKLHSYAMRNDRQPISLRMSLLVTAVIKCLGEKGCRIMVKVLSQGLNGDYFYLLIELELTLEQ